ncbi:hypothetical protein [Nocardioides sambongensis]|uniref:hypothetical protein n=1 Tax=Nocardioides sambongensis TaxID=2589074 RepID=UPI001126DA1A|nr:hypothetical protein [Nocardioides sambongensis]
MRLTTIGAVGIAYVIGARAGRERYEQIRAAAQTVARRMESYGEDGSLATRVDGWWNHATTAARRDE